jgi:hypothetical protein
MPLIGRNQNGRSFFSYGELESEQMLLDYDRKNKAAF